MRSGAGHDSQGNVWHKIEDEDCDFIDSEELKIGLPYPSVVNIEHGGMYLARPIPYGHYLNDSNDHEAEIDDGTPPEEFTNRFNAHGRFSFVKESSNYISFIRCRLCVYRCESLWHNGEFK
jgi:hypothetical protein